MKYTFNPRTKVWTDRHGNVVDEPPRRPINNFLHRVKTTNAGYPVASDACGVHPDQREDAFKESEKFGVPTQFDHEGRAVFTSRQHQNAYCRMKGFFNKDAGYGDPAP